MFKLFTVALAATSIGAATAAPAYACGCSCSAMPMTMSAQDGAPMSTAQAPSTSRTYRSFSYEPSIGGSYFAPRMQSSQPSRSSGTPRYLLPKTDPRKYRN